MTIFGKVLLGLILATAAVLIIKGAGKGNDEIVLAPEGEEVVADTPAPAEQEVGTFQGSAKDLMARGGDHKCTFTQEVENSKSTGTIYISGTKMRGDFNSNVLAGGTTMDLESHMISDGATMWTWSNMMPTGFKMAVDQSAQAGGQQQGFDANVDLEYTCINWAPDQSQFVVPSAITFTEFKAQ